MCQNINTGISPKLLVKLPKKRKKNNKPIQQNELKQKQKKIKIRGLNYQQIRHLDIPVSPENAGLSLILNLKLCFLFWFYSLAVFAQNIAANDCKSLL